MNPLYYVLLALHFVTSPTVALADSIAPLQYSTTTASVIISAYAIHYGITARPLIDTLKCESGFNDTAVGDNNSSFGVAQIHLPAHPDITKEEALNPFFSIDWAAREFAAGRANEWTCYRNLQGKPAP